MRGNMKYFSIFVLVVSGMEIHFSNGTNVTITTCQKQVAGQLCKVTCKVPNFEETVTIFHPSGTIIIECEKQKKCVKKQNIDYQFKDDRVNNTLSLFINNLDKIKHSGSWRCRWRSQNSNLAAVNICDPASESPVVLSAVRKKPFIIGCNAEYHDWGEKYKVSWYKDGKMIVGNEKYEGIHEKSLMIKYVHDDDKGIYGCSIATSEPNVYNGSRIKLDRVIDNYDKRYTTYLSAIKGRPLSLKCDVERKINKSNIMWYKNDKELTNSGSYFEIKEDILTIKSVDEDSVGFFFCSIETTLIKINGSLFNVYVVSSTVVDNTWMVGLVLGICLLILVLNFVSYRCKQQSKNKGNAGGEGEEEMNLIPISVENRSNRTEWKLYISATGDEKTKRRKSFARPAIQYEELDIILKCQLKEKGTEEIYNMEIASANSIWITYRCDNLLIMLTAIAGEIFYSQINIGDIQIYGFTFPKGGEIWITVRNQQDGGNKIKRINNYGKISDMYDLHPWSFTTCIHLSDSGILYVGVVSSESYYNTNLNNRSAVLKFKDGEKKAEFELDEKNCRLFTKPQKVLEIEDGTLWVIDKFDYGKSRLVVLNTDGTTKFIFTGPKNTTLVKAPEHNNTENDADSDDGETGKDSKFFCSDLKSAGKQRVLLSEFWSPYLHLMSKDGEILHSVSFVNSMEYGYQTTAFSVGKDALWFGSENGHIYKFHRPDNLM